MKEGTASLLKMLNDAGDNPLAHDEWVSAWQTLYDDFKNSPGAANGFADIEHAAIGALSSKPLDNTDIQLGNELCRMLDNFKHSALLVDSNGRIVAFNVMLYQNYSLNIGDHIQSLPVTLSLSESLEDVIKRTLQDGANKHEAIFKQAFSDNTSKELTLAITPSTGQFASALVFIISCKWQDQATAQIKQQFGLTTAECDVLVSFVEGYSSKEIAQIRNRSYATIRTQLQSLMAKMGANSQAALLRKALSLSDFVTEISKFNTVLEHPHRRRADIMRAGGRLVEVVFTGDPNGIPVVHSPTVATYCFNPQAEKQLFEAGLYVITVCPPGYGRTDNATVAKQRMQCRAEDIAAVLDMLDISSCPLITSNAGTAPCLELATMLPNRISQLVLIAACPPIGYWTTQGSGAPWVDAVLRVSEKYTTMRRLIIAAGLKAWCAIGSKQFHRLQVAGNQEDVKILSQPENVVEIEYALTNAMASGLGPVMEDISMIFRDCLHNVHATSLKISILHGDKDPVFPVQGMRDFAADFPDKVHLKEFKNTGFTIMQTNLEEVIQFLTEITTAPSNAVNLGASPERVLSTGQFRY